MKVLVVYDSTYGNTEKIARAIGAAIGGEVKVVRAGTTDVSELKSLGVLIVGSPTQGFRATKNVQKFIQEIPDNALKGVKVAAFDTRVIAEDVGRALRLVVQTGGYAAPRMAKALQKKGGSLAVPPEGFFVTDKEGPLKEGELQRAAAWARDITRD